VTREEMTMAETTQIKAPSFKVVTFTLRGTAPYVSNKFSAEAREMMRAKQAAGAQAKKGAKREAKDFDKCFRESMHSTSDGKQGVPASCFRQALVSACRIVGFKMTLAKLALFVQHDAIDADDASPLVLFTKGTPQHFESATRNETGVADIRVRGKWDAGWEMKLRVQFDADMFSEADVRNLLTRVGIQVGIGAGRPDSKTSCGQGSRRASVRAEEKTMGAIDVCGRCRAVEVVDDDGLCFVCRPVPPCAECRKRNGLCAQHQPSLEAPLRASMRRSGIYVIDAAAALAAEPRGSL
jgi:hypothetical protein